MNEKTITCHDSHSFKCEHKYLFNIDYFSLQSNTIFGSLDCDYTLLAIGMVLQGYYWHVY